MMEHTVQMARQQVDCDASTVRDAETSIGAVMTRFRDSTEGIAEAAAILRSEGSGVREDIAALIVDLQFQDRMSQILRQVMSDMTKLEAALVQPDARSALSPEQWLQNMERTYATHEQRVNHGLKGDEPAGSINFF